MKILFLSVSTGGGHINAAKALKELVLAKYLDAECLIVDTLKYINPSLDRLIVGGYLSLVRNVPKLYGSLYKLSEYDRGINSLTSSSSRFLSKYLIDLIEDFSPSLIVCTHTFPLQMVSYLKEKKLLSKPIIAVVTDYVNHPFWNLKNIDALVVPGMHVKKDMIKTGIPQDIIYSYGIPLSKDFINKNDRKEIQNHYQLQNKLTALIMGGSLGIRSVYSSFKLIMNSKRDIQIIIVTGKNDKLKEKIKQELISFPLDKQKNVKLLGYVENISALMDVSDFIITKAGGMTISEALVKELPIFLISPIPGQEERNASFLINNGAAIAISPSENIDIILDKTIFNPKQLEYMKQKSKSLAYPNATYDTINLFEQLLNSNQV